MEEFLRSALPLARNEPATTAWFAVRFGRHEFGIIDVFPDEAGRQAHLEGPIAQALRSRADELLARPPEIHRLDVLAEKLPQQPLGDGVTKGVLLRFKPKATKGPDVEQFLRDARPLVEREPGTTAWFAIRLDDGEYGIFDVFPHNGDRMAHLTGRVPRALAKHAFSLLGSLPRMELPSVLVDKLAPGAAGPSR